MESTIDFIESNWDVKSDLSTLHLSCLVNSLLPLQLFKLKISSDFFNNISTELLRGKNDFIQRMVCTGSVADGLHIPGFIHKHESTQEFSFEQLSDIDFLLIANALIYTSESSYNPALPESLGYLECVEDCPGYVRICVAKPDTDEDFIAVDPVGNKRYFSLTKLYECLSKGIIPTFAKQQGPAISTSIFFNKFNSGNGMRYDLVYAIPCLPWPIIAAEWKKRVENSTWLSPQNVNAIIKEGCHVVAVPSKKSKNPELEWRLSFSAMEGRLAQEAVTDYQRQCFIYIKILHHQKTKRKGILTSYMFKSVFLHSCEKLPVNYWKNQQGSCILYTLDSLIECLRRKHVPTYFLPENNLIRHLSDDEIQESIKDVESLRNDPITPVLKFMDDKSFYYHNTAVPFRQMVAPLLEDIAAFKNHEDQARALEITEKIRSRFQCRESPFVDCAYKNLFVPIVIDLVRKGTAFFDIIIKPNFSEIELSPILKLISVAVQFLPIEIFPIYADVFDLSGEIPGIKYVRGTFARIFHAANYLPHLRQEEKNECMKLAEEHFKAVYESGESVVDYAAYLVKQDKLKHARCILEKFLAGRKTKGDGNEYFWYDFKFKDCLVGPLKNHIVTNGFISGDDMSFAYFYLIYCIINNKQMDSSESAEQVLREFEEYHTKTKDNNTFVILKYAKMLMQNTHENRASLEITLD